MKKLFLFCIFLLIGCSGKSNLSISELSKQLDQLELNKIDIEKALVGITQDFEEKELIDISDEMSKYVDFSKIKQSVFYKNDELFLFIYESTDESIKKGISQYFDDVLSNPVEPSLRESIVNRIEYQYEDFYIYVAGPKQKRILEKILETKVLLFHHTTKLSDDISSVKFGVELKNDIIAWSTKLDEEFGYIVLSNANEEVQKSLDEYFEKNKDKLAGSLLKTTKDDIVIYVVSEDNNKVLKIIDKVQ